MNLCLLSQYELITQTYLTEVHVFLKYLAISIPEPADAIHAIIKKTVMRLDVLHTCLVGTLALVSSLDGLALRKWCSEDLRHSVHQF